MYKPGDLVAYSYGEDAEIIVEVTRYDAPLYTLRWPYHGLVLQAQAQETELRRPPVRI